MARTKTRKLYVLDTNVLLHDPNSLFHFAEHDVYVPFVTLEELDGKKVGTTDVNRNARMATRLLDELSSQAGKLEDGYPLKPFNGGQATGRLYLQHTLVPFLENEHLRKNDNQYLAILAHLVVAHPGHKAILVSKDINLRIKAKGMGFDAEDYRSDHTVEDADLLHRGMHQFDDSFWAKAGRKLESWTKGEHTYYRLPQKKPVLQPNELVQLPGMALIVAESTPEFVTLRTMRDFSGERHQVWGISSRNIEQNFALNLLLDPGIDFITLLGPAGTGKTLLALAAGLDLCFEQKRHSEIIFTRATVPMGEDIGFLPGTEEEKMGPWLGAMQDNLDVLLPESGQSDWARSVSREYVMQKVKIKSMSFMRGRTFHKKFVIIDEAQNLTPKQMKSLITRAGADTKVICMGNLSQIDTPYLSEASSGLTYAVERFKGWPHYGHIILSKGERSRLADYANENM
jgi:PhoH-like ATPase